MIRIVYLVSTLRRAGPTTQLYNIIANLDRSLFEPIVVTLSPEPQQTKLPDFQAAGIKVISMELSRLAGIFHGRQMLRELCERLEPSVIHSQGIRGDVLSAHSDFDGVKVATIRNFPQRDYPLTYGNLLGRAMTMVHMRAVRRLDCVVGVSEAVRDNLGEFFDMANLVAIPNGVDFTRFGRDIVRRTEIRRELKVADADRVWISSGHISDRKDPITILNAWKRAKPTRGSRVLLFLGDGPLMSECQRIAEGEQKIRFIGRVDRVSEYLSAADMFVSAATAEGLPNAVLEAMACGLPVLLSDIPPHREIWTKSPNSGSLFPVGDVDALAEHIVQYSTREIDAQARASEKLVQDHYNAATMSKGYQRLYRTQIEKKKSP